MNLLAPESLPAKFEGVFRKYMVLPDATVRYSITDEDWPGVRVNLGRRLEAARGRTRPL